MVLDSSALIATLLSERHEAWVRATLRRNEHAPFRMSWVNAAEVGITCESKGKVGGQASFDVLRRFHIELPQPDFAVLALAVRARRKFPLNFGDSFAYAHAKLLGEPLLTPDADFLRTDLPHVLHPSRP